LNFDGRVIGDGIAGYSFLIRENHGRPLAMGYGTISDSSAPKTDVGLLVLGFGYCYLL